MACASPRLALALTYPWAGISAIRRVDEDSDEPIDELVLEEDYTGQIRNPLLRFLHGQAYGRTKLPIYAGLANREELLDEIRRRAGLEEPADQTGNPRQPASQARFDRSAWPLAFTLVTRGA